MNVLSHYAEHKPIVQTVEKDWLPEGIPGKKAEESKSVKR